jgi:chorismate lyase
MGLAMRGSLRAWLQAPGSLSRRLAALGRGFEVELLRQGLARLLPAERAVLGTRGPSLVREVVLRVSGEPVVWARSAVAARATRGPWKALKGLANRPLAHLLYGDPRIHRSELQPLRLPRCSRTRRRLAQGWQRASGSAPPAGMLWSRHSVFRRHGAALRVMEVFAPQLAAAAPGPKRISGKPLPPFWVQTLGGQRRSRS